MEKMDQQGLSNKKIPLEYTPVVFNESLEDDTIKFQYGATIQQLRPGIEVQDKGGLKLSLPVTLSRTSATGTGTQVITGVGFTPKLIEITACYGSTSEGTLSFGSYDGTTHNVYYTYQNGTASGANNANNAIIRVTNNAGALMTRASISTIGSDGFTLNWDTMDLNVTFTYKCYG